MYIFIDCSLVCSSQTKGIRCQSQPQNRGSNRPFARFTVQSFATLLYVMIYPGSRTPAPPRGMSVPKSPLRLTRRSASVRQPSQVSGPSRTSSIIVHDIDEEGDEECEEVISEDLLEEQPTPLLVPPPRTRKAKELQTRLGKGKPVIAGGSGPRAITASSGSSKGRQTKSSKTMKPREPTIEEGNVLQMLFYFVS